MHNALAILALSLALAPLGCATGGDAAGDDPGGPGLDDAAAAPETTPHKDGGSSGRDATSSWVDTGTPVGDDTSDAQAEAAAGDDGSAAGDDGGGVEAGGDDGSTSSGMCPSGSKYGVEYIAAVASGTAQKCSGPGCPAGQCCYVVLGVGLCVGL
jgi:hypothetical protein